MAFRVVKWYLDLTGPDGSGAIVYAADIGVAGLHLVANAILTWDASTTPTSSRADERTALRTARMPEPTADGWRWSCERLGADGRWTRPHGAVIERTLFADAAAAGGRDVRWSCIAPTSHARLTLPGRTIEGPGYVERLEITIEPWRLPLTTLRWGRAASYARSIVWIQWTGEHPLNLILVDGVEHEAISIDDEHVRWRGGELSLRAARTLRDAPLAAGALAWLPALSDALPLRFLRAHETKWLGVARAATDDDATELPVIWERVAFDTHAPLPNRSP